MSLSIFHELKVAFAITILPKDGEIKILNSDIYTKMLMKWTKINAYETLKFSSMQLKDIRDRDWVAKWVFFVDNLIKYEVSVCPYVSGRVCKGGFANRNYSYKKLKIN